MDAETRKRLELRADDDAEAADFWKQIEGDGVQTLWRRQKSADLRAALAEIDRLTEQIRVIAGERHWVYQGGITDAPGTTLDEEHARR